MDLGSFKTSVMSSCGCREVLPSAVGWPKDHVSRLVFGREIVFGEDILKDRLALDVVWPFERGSLKFLSKKECRLSEEVACKHLEAARLLVEQAVSQVRGEERGPVYGVLGAPSRASIECKQVLLSAVESAFEAAMIVPEPFAVAYGMNRLTNALVVDIGAGTTDICPMYGALPRDEDQVTLPLGGDAIDERICRAIEAAYPEAALSKNLARTLKERHANVDDDPPAAVVLLSVRGKPVQADVAPILRDACQVLVDPIVEGIVRVVSEIDPEYQRSMLDNIILAGGGSQLRGLDRKIEQGLADAGGGSVRRVYDSVFAGAAGSLKLAMRMPREEWERLRTVEMALS
jgi:rod shape-determining protein MreB